VADNEMLLQLDALAENVSVARVAVAAFASRLPFTLADLEEIKVAVSEAVSNVVVHAYGAQAGKLIIVARLSTGDGAGLEVEISDTGRGIGDVALAMTPAYTTEADRMGLGFSFIDSFMDEVVVRSQPGEGTTVRLRRGCRTEETGAPEGEVDGGCDSAD